MGSSDPIERVGAICAEVGFDLSSVTPSLLARLRLLEEHSETVSDFEHMARRARDVFRHYETTKAAEKFSEDERRIVILGCLFADIGKTGPAIADEGGQRLIVEMFAVEGVRDDTQPVAKFLRAHFPADADDRISRFAALGLDPAMTMRQFWNLHSGWTLDILEAGSVPPEAIGAAATHHLLDDINPDDIVASDRRFTRPFGDNHAFDRAEKLIILLDKYDALRRRGRKSHDEAIAWLRERVNNNLRFRGNAEFLTLIADLDAAVSA